MTRAAPSCSGPRSTDGGIGLRGAGIKEKGLAADAAGIPAEWKDDLKRFGKLRSYTEWGCYPLIYRSANGGTFCPDCATAEIKEGRWACELKNDRITMRDVLYEGSSICDECGEVIESAYGDPDDEEESKDDGE